MAENVVGFEERSPVTQQDNGSFIAEQFTSRMVHFVLTIPLGIQSFLWLEILRTKPEVALSAR